MSSIVLKCLKVFCILTLSFGFYYCGKDNDNRSQGKTENKSPENPNADSNNTELKVSDDFIVDYDLVGKMNGNMRIYRKGNKLKQSINSEIMGMKNKNDIYIIDNFVFSVTEVANKKFGVRTNLQDFNMQKQTGETITDFRQFEKFLEEKKIIGSENILGHNGDIYDLGNGLSLTVYNKRYILRIKSPEFMATATKIESNPVFASNEFDLPANIEFKNVNPQSKKNGSLDSILNQFKK